MTSKPPTSDESLRREIIVVAALTLIGGVLRVWSFGRVGLNHFDEGVYALAGLWSISTRGLGDLDPSLVPYAPPGFPILIGCAYLCLGVADASAIGVSAACGTLTIPVTAWLARRTFGSGAGGAAAALAAISGPHVAFSRMALVDVTFLLVWLVALGLGQRFLERPGPVRAAALGLAVGLSQLFKYNGFTSGFIIAASAAIWMVFRREERRVRTLARTWGWGLCAAIVAALCYWPWFQFVETHGGYPALLAHHRRYLGGIGSWPGHLAIQLAQARMLSGGPIWLAGAGLAAALAMLVSVGDFEIWGVNMLRSVVLAASLAFGCVWLMPELVLLYVPVWLGFALASRMSFATRSMCTLGVGWASLALLTPLYHPYARLWLPLQALTWLFVGGLFVSIRANWEVPGRGLGWSWKGTADRLPWLAMACLAGAVLRVMPGGSIWNQSGLGVLEPSDSLRLAATSIPRKVPPEVTGLRVLARPPVLFYLALAGRADILRQPDLRRLLEPGPRPSWAILDMALVRQDNVTATELSTLMAPWARVDEVPAELNLATLLDVDPAAATNRAIDARAPLVILRLQPAGGTR
jgi:dolichyl-phosphate-mannose-protein mannosyltransferase